MQSEIRPPFLRRESPWVRASMLVSPFGRFGVIAAGKVAEIEGNAAYRIFLGIVFSSVYGIPEAGYSWLAHLRFDEAFFCTF